MNHVFHISTHFPIHSKIQKDSDVGDVDVCSSAGRYGKSRIKAQRIESCIGRKGDQGTKGKRKVEKKEILQILSPFRSKQESITNRSTGPIFWILLSFRTCWLLTVFSLAEIQHQICPHGFHAKLQNPVWQSLQLISDILSDSLLLPSSWIAHKNKTEINMKERMKKVKKQESYAFPLVFWDLPLSFSKISYIWCLASPIRSV